MQQYGNWSELKMIKIQLDEDTKQDVMDVHWKDMRHKQTGLYKSLQDSSSMTVLKSRLCYKILYDYFYDLSGNVIEQNVKNLVLANGSRMKEYIAYLGKFNKIESDELQKNVFRYDNFAIRKSAYKILKKMKVNVCPYCNRQYTYTLENNSIRPQFDHFYPKSLYPYLAVSIFNLIPSCSICNQAKSSLDTYNEPILYPYEDEFGESAKFALDTNDIKSFLGIGENFELSINYSEMDSAVQDKIKKQNDVLHLERIYNMHKDYVCDITLNQYINSDDRINEILLKFPDLFDSKEDVLSVLHMNDIRRDNWGKRPLSKLTHDILKNIK